MEETSPPVIPSPVAVPVPSAHRTPPEAANLRNTGVRVGKFIRDNLTLAVIVGILAVAGYLTDSYVGSLHDQVTTLGTELTTEKSMHETEVSDLRQEISEMLPSSINFPIPYDPINGASVVGKSVTLQWSEKAAHANYLVELTRLVPEKTEDWGQPQVFPATDPSKMRTRYPLGEASTIDPGAYLWRVVPGTESGPYQRLEGGWSGYYKFTVYGTVMDRIRRTHTLRVGVSYVQNSDFMSKDADGNAAGFDADLVRILAKQLSSDKQLGIANDNELKVEFRDYPSIDQILFHGIEQGEIDLGIGSITRAKYRERRGIRFTRGYLESKLVLLANPGDPGPKFTEDEKIAAIKETANFEALQYLQKKYYFQAFPADSYQDLLNKLQDHSVDYVVIDEPLASDLIASGTYVVAKDLSSDLGDYIQQKVGYHSEEYAIATNDATLRDKMDQLLKSPMITKLIASLKTKYKLSGH